MITDDNLSFTDDYVKCTRTECFCNTDMISTKILPAELYPQDK